MLQVYNESVNSTYSNGTARQNLLKFGSSRGELTGSNIPMLIHLQESGLLSGARIANRADLEKALQLGLNLSGNYVDFGIALRGENVSYDSNRTSATNLVSQLMQRGISLGKGRLIPISALTMKEDANSEYGITLGLKDEASEEVMPHLAELKWNYETNEGIARAYLNRNGDWNSNNDNLANSNDNGRIAYLASSYFRWN